MDHSLTPQFVTTIDRSLTQGVLYVSEEFQTVVHLCPCGCGQEVVTPFGIGRKGWDYKRDAADRVTLHPSVGNYQIPCRSHYWIRENNVMWC